MPTGAHLRGKARTPGSGRRPGQVNKVTAVTRQFFQKLLDDNGDKIQGWLNRIARRDPEKALRLLVDVAEYCLPKLARSDTHVHVHRDLGDYTDDDLQVLAQQEPHALSDQRILDAAVPAGGPGGAGGAPRARPTRRGEKKPRLVRRVRKG